MECSQTSFTIRLGSMAQAVAVSRQVPEFEAPYGLEEYEKRLTGVSHLILIAEMEGKPVGFKVGYERYADASFYSWMGGVLPNFRNRGVADALANEQETWAKAKGYRSIRLKTRNKYKSMLCFALKRGFFIIGLGDKCQYVDDYRIVLEKLM